MCVLKLDEQDKLVTGMYFVRQVWLCSKKSNIALAENFVLANAGEVRGFHLHSNGSFAFLQYVCASIRILITLPYAVLYNTSSPLDGTMHFKQYSASRQLQVSHQLETNRIPNDNWGLGHSGLDYGDDGGTHRYCAYYKVEGTTYVSTFS